MYFSNKFNIFWVHIFQVQGIFQARKTPSMIPYALETVMLSTPAEVAPCSQI